MERGENDKVMDFVAENDLKERGKIRIVLCPNAELGVGGNDHLVRLQFIRAKIAVGNAFFVEVIGHSQGRVLGKAFVAVFSIYQIKGFPRTGGQRGDFVDGSGGLAAAAGSGDKVQSAAAKTGRVQHVREEFAVFHTDKISPF